MAFARERCTYAIRTMRPRRRSVHENCGREMRGDNTRVKSRWDCRQECCGVGPYIPRSGWYAVNNTREQWGRSGHIQIRRVPSWGQHYDFEWWEIEKAPNPWGHVIQRRGMVCHGRCRNLDRHFRVHCHHDHLIAGNGHHLDALGHVRRAGCPKPLHLHTFVCYCLHVDWHSQVAEACMFAISGLRKASSIVLKYFDLCGHNTGIGWLTKYRKARHPHAAYR